MPPFAALLAAWLLNAFWPIIGIDGVKLFDTVLFFHAGMVVGLLTILPWLLRGGRWRRALRADAVRPLVAMSILSAAASLIYLQALRYTTPANAAVMAQIEVLYSAVLSAWLLRESIGMSQVSASFLVVAGTGLIMAYDLGSLRWKGDLMILLTPWLYQLSHVCAKRLPKDLDPVLLSGARMFYTVCLMLPLSLWALAHGPHWSWSGAGLRVLLLQGVLLNTISITFWYSAILRLDLAKATAFLLSYPALTMLLSWALGREQIHPLQVAGLVVTLGGAFWLSRITLAVQNRAAAGPRDRAARPDGSSAPGTNAPLWPRNAGNDSSPANVPVRG